MKDNNSNTLIVIPARYGSTRLPGKPLVNIHGMTMLERVYCAAVEASSAIQGCRVVIATDDERIEEHARQIGAEAVMTDPACSSGTERAYLAASMMDTRPEFVLNLQGDTPLTPVGVISEVLTRLIDKEKREAVVTPVIQLTWQALRALREHKKKSPFSGTTVIIGDDGRALWFSKNIIPAIRGESFMEDAGGYSPVYMHIGMYGYPMDLLEEYVHLSESRYERIESLEQLRLLENNIVIDTVDVKVGDMTILGGVDTEADLDRVSSWLYENGDPCAVERK